MIGKFELTHQIIDGGLNGVNFNSEYIAFDCTVAENEKSRIYVYKYDDALLSFDFDGVISEFVSYDKIAFLSVDGNIYRFNINDNSTERIAELSADDISLLVGSDDEVYVSSVELNGIRRYSVDGKYEDVILN